MSAQPAATSQACFCRRPPVRGISAKPTDRRRLKENPTAGGLARGARRAAGSPRWLWKGSAGDPFMGRVTLVTVPPYMTYGVLILGSTMPWEEYYPRPGQARGVQVDLKPDRLGLRYPVEVGVTGDVKATLQAPCCRCCSAKAIAHSSPRRSSARPNGIDCWTRLRLPHALRCGRKCFIRVVTDLLADNAIISLDCGANTHFAARCLRLRADQRFTGTGMLASMAPGLPYAIAAKLAYPDRQSVAIVGDGGFAMLMAELTTAVSNNLPVKIILLKNNSLAEVKFEQQDIGNPEYGCALGPIDFVAFAKACGADGSVAIGPTMSARTFIAGRERLPSSPSFQERSSVFREG
jgi:thiamine pyrophosphate-dependent acetolactate synthase large subunit-like protein